MIFYTIHNYGSATGFINEITNYCKKLFTEMRLNETAPELYCKYSVNIQLCVSIRHYSTIKNEIYSTTKRGFKGLLRLSHFRDFHALDNRSGPL